MVVMFKDENTESFRHLFLQDYQDDVDEFALHTQSDVYRHINYAIEQVHSSSLLVYIIVCFVKEGELTLHIVYLSILFPVSLKSSMRLFLGLGE